MKKSVVYLLLVFSAACWGVSFIFTRQLFDTEPALTVVTLITFRLVIATLVMAPVLLLSHRWQRIRKGDLKWFLLLSLCEPFLYCLCESGSLRFVDGSLASVIIATIPLIVPFGLKAVYGGKIGYRLVVGLAVSVIGVMLTAVENISLQASWRGLLLLAGAIVVSIAYMIIIVKVVDKYKPVMVTTYQNLFGLVFFLPLMFAMDSHALPQLSFSLSFFAMVAVLGLFCSTLAYVFYNYGIRKLGAASASAFINVSPAFALVAAFILGQESPSVVKIIGVVVAIAGVYIGQRK